MQQPTLADLDNAPVSLPSHQQIAAEDEVETLKARLQEVSEELNVVRQEYDSYKRRSRGADFLDEMITPYAGKIYWFMVCYCVFVGLALFMNGFNCFHNQIDTTVMSFLVGSTATTVLGLVGMVVTGIFSGARGQKE